MTRIRAAAAAAILAIALLPAAGAPAETYDIPMIASLTGPAAFLGNGQLQGLRAVETAVNKAGGLAGKAIRFVPRDDQSNPQISVQIARELIGQSVPLIVGPSSTATCNAVAPLPLLYCLTPGVLPVAGSYVFVNLPSTPAQIDVGIRYMRDHGWKRIAELVTTDATGQGADQAIETAFAAPENKDLHLVDREYFGVTDLSVAAQIARIKASNPDALVTWIVGTSAGTAFRGLRDAGVDLPTLMSSGNLTPSFVKQYGPLFPYQLFTPVIPYYVPDDANRATKAAIDALNVTARSLGVEPEQVFISAWDPGMLLVDALRKLGPNVTAERLRAYLANLKGWVGACGPYDFRASPQRGLGLNSIVIVRRAPGENVTFVQASKLGGAPLNRH